VVAVEPMETTEEFVFTAHAGNKSKELKNLWILDSGASHHMTPYKDIFDNLNEGVRGNVIMAKKKTSTPLLGKGSVALKVTNEYGGRKLRLTNCSYVPGLDCNLLSMRQLDRLGCEAHIRNGLITVAKDGVVIFVAKGKEDQLYHLQCEYYTVSGKSLMCNSSNKMEIEKRMNFMKDRAMKCEVIWHQRFGHMETLPKLCGVNQCQLNCDVCITGKLHRKKFYNNSKSAENVLDVIHSDVCGKITPQSLGGKQYFVTFLDDNSRFSTVEVLTNKSEVLPAFQRYVEKVEVLQERRIKFLQSDNGGEYCSAAFNEYLNQKGIGRRLSVAGTPQQNGRSERLNRTLLCIVRCILENAGLPKSFWGEAVRTASNIRNCCPSKAIQGRIPIEVWSKKTFTVDMAKEMKVFGCRAWDLDLNVKNKLDNRAVECIYLGSASDAKGYRFYSVNEKKIRISRDARFEESFFPYKTVIPKTVFETKRRTPIYVYDSDCTDIEDNVDEKDANPDVENDINVNNLNDLGDVPQENIQPRRSVRTIKQKVVCECCAKMNCVEIALTEPKSVGEVFSRNDRDQWVRAMKTEIENLKKNQT
jgi:hypothetical protein